MKHLSRSATPARIVTRLLAAALLVAAVGCKGSSSSARSERAGDQARLGPLLPPGAGGRLGDPANQEARDVARRQAARGPGARPDRGDRGDRPWAGGQLSPEDRQARRDEMMARREERRQEMMETYDADHDGQLSETERGVMHEARVAEMVDRLDTDRDGKLSKAELEDMVGRGRRPPPDFANLDADKDGFLSVEEMTKAMPPRGPRGGWGGRDDGDGPPGPPRPTRAVPAPTTTPAPTATPATP